MNILRKLNFVLVTFLGITAGIPKVMRLPAEVTFFDNAGLSGPTIVVFGVLQMIGGVLLLFPKTRTWAAASTAIMFFSSAVMVLVSGQLSFGCLSLLPVFMAGFVSVDNARKRTAKPTGAT